MHHYRQALLRMRQGDSDRDIAEARIMGRRKAGQWRALAQAHGWLDTQAPLRSRLDCAQPVLMPWSCASAHRARLLANAWSFHRMGVWLCLPWATVGSVSK